MKKNILVVCPKDRDRQELKQFNDKYNIQFHPFDTTQFRSFIYKKKAGNAINSANIVDDIIFYIKKHNIDGILSSDDYPGSLFASIAAQECNLVAPTPNSIILCQHKYLSRLMQKKYVRQAAAHAQLLEYTKAYTAQDVPPFPFFIKPIKACHSVGAQRIGSIDELVTYLKNNNFPHEFSDPLDWAIKKYTQYNVPSHACIAEEYLDGTIQVTIEGYAFNGQIQMRGIVDSIMYPGTISFARFEYPSQLHDEVQKRMANISKHFMQQIGFNNGLFNIELMYNDKTDAIHIIEVNSRMASQYADIYEKVDGTNTYEIALSIAVGKNPKVKKQKGIYKTAASFPMRIFNDALVRSVPDNNEIQKVKNRFEQTRISIVAQPGQHLSDCLQDGHSYRYCMLHLGAKNHSELLLKFKTCQKMLHFKFDLIH
ncbi:MAG: ATP-grasp domain-containing protein [Candidatus Dependentiae bacterium]